MKHVGRYYEAQIGPAPTQMHTFPLPASSTFEWTEWFKGFDGDVERLQAILALIWPMLTDASSGLMLSTK